MPKVKRTATEDKRCAVRATIAKYTEYYKISNPELAKLLGSAESTIYKKKKRPETFTLGELWILSEIFKCPVEELTKGKVGE